MTKNEQSRCGPHERNGHRVGKFLPGSHTQTGLDTHTHTGARPSNEMAKGMGFTRKSIDRPAVIGGKGAENYYRATQIMSGRRGLPFYGLLHTLLYAPCAAKRGDCGDR